MFGFWKINFKWFYLSTVLCQNACISQLKIIILIFIYMGIVMREIHQFEKKNLNPYLYKVLSQIKEGN